MTKDDDDIRKALDAFEREHGSVSLHFDRQGKSITLGEWAVLFEDKGYQVLVQTWTLHGAWVSTVWLGLDHQWGDGPPIIFETMVWHDGNDTTQERYSTEAAAAAGHEAIVARFGGRDPNPPLDAPGLRAQSGSSLFAAANDDEEDEDEDT